jgi:signal transduction histidine kinase
MQAIRKQIGNANAKESFSLNQAVSHVIQLISYQANKQRAVIIFHTEASQDIFHFDAPFKFQEIVINLLLNAIESYESFPRTDARVRAINLTLKKDGGMAVLCVDDNGCGMTPAVHARIFEPFFTTKESIKGIGIGLPTIKKIIEEDMQGTIAATSQPERGSTFTVTFPIKYEEVSSADRPSDKTYKGPTIP